MCGIFDIDKLLLDLYNIMYYHLIVATRYSFLVATIYLNLKKFESDAERYYSPQNMHRYENKSVWGT